MTYSAALDAEARCRRDGGPLATVTYPGQEQPYQGCNYDALRHAKDLVRLGRDVRLVTERGNELDSAAIAKARY